MRRVLIIEDNPKEMAVTRNSVLAAGLFPDCVATGEEALSNLLKANYAYLLIEPCVKGMNLPLVISLANKQNVGTVAITKDSSLTSERKLREMGVLYYMVKPINPAELALVVGSSKEVHQPEKEA
ncbi:MAG: hypothetical protein ACE5JU_12085 [Candidatus Binatia bacterium]